MSHSTALDWRTPLRSRRRGQAMIELVFSFPLLIALLAIIFTVTSLTIARSHVSIGARNKAFSGRHEPWQASDDYRTENLNVTGAPYVGIILGPGPKMPADGGLVVADDERPVERLWGPFKNMIGDVEHEHAVLGGVWDVKEIEFRRHPRLTPTEKASYFGVGIPLSGLSALIGGGSGGTTGGQPLPPEPDITADDSGGDVGGDSAGGSGDDTAGSGGGGGSGDVGQPPGSGVDKPTPLTGLVKGTPKENELPDEITLSADANKTIQSLSDKSIDKNGNSVEHAGTLALDLNGDLVVINEKSGSSGAVTPDTNVPQGYTYVGTVHTHPYGKNDGSWNGAEIPFSGDDFGTLDDFNEKVSVVQSGNQLYVLVATDKTPKKISDSDADRAYKKAFFAEYRQQQKNGKSDKEAAEIAGEKATQALAKKYHLGYYKGTNGGTLTRVVP